MKHFCLSLFVSFILTLLIGCQNRQTADFTTYISGYTGGTITSSSSVFIHLNQEVMQGFQVGSDLPDEILTFSPSIKGRTILKENQCVEFIPEEPFENGKTYQASFQLGALCQVEQAAEKFCFQFQIIPLSIVFEAGELNLETDATDFLRYQGILHCSDYLPNAQIEKMVQAEYQSKNIPLEWIHSGNRHHFQIRKLQKGENSEILNIIFSQEIANAKKESISIPSKEEFDILNVQTTDSDPICLLIQLTEPLNPQQDLRGLVELKNHPIDHFSINQNVIRIYLPHSIEKEEITMQLHPGIQALSGKTLKTRYTTTIPIQTTKPEVKFIGKGVIVPDQNKVLIPFSAVGLKAVDIEIIEVFQQNMNYFLQNNSYDGMHNLIQTARPLLLKKIELNEKYPELNLSRWNDFTIDLSELVKLEKGIIYRIRLKFKKSYTTLDCANEGPDSEYNTTDWDARQEYTYYSEYEYPESYSWKERNNPSHLSYYTGERFVARNLINTSIGITAKEGIDNQYVVSVNDLTTTEPIANCKLSFYNYQNQKMDSILTDNNGFAQLRTPNKTFIIVAQKGDDRSWLRLSDGNALSLSNFDVSGQEIQSGVKGFVYGERGVWRPGDKIHLSLILEDKLQLLPSGHPIVAQLTDPNGRTTETIKRSIGSNNIYCFTFKTEAEAQTGYWTANFQIGGISFKKSIRIETIKPNRLSIQTLFPHEEIIGKGVSESTIQVHTRWLNGARTSRQKAQTEVKLYHNNAGFAEFPDYTFSDRSRHFEPIQELLFDGITDTQGSFSFSLDQLKTEQAPGILQALFTTRVYENSGDFSISTESKRYSPYSEYVGIRLPKTEGNWLSTQEPVQLHGVTVTPEGTQKGNSTLRLDVYRLNWHWWWDSENDHLSSYINRQYSKSILTQKIQVKDGKFSTQLPIREYGRYFIQITSPSGHSTGLTAYFGSWAEINSQETATMLQLTTDKKSYTTGETIRVTFPSTAGNSALITLENGKTIHKIQRVITQAGATTFEIKAEKTMCPNIYIGVSMLQPHNKRDNDHPIRMYGVLNIQVEDPELHLMPIIQMPKELIPGKEFTVEVKEQKGKNMNYTIAIVDEGLLSLTAFKTPDPYSSFYTREALGVKTWDYYDYIYGAYGVRLDRAFAVGGDEALQNLQDENTNRFKPVVLFEGPFSLEAGKSRKHTFKMPEYLGEVRTTVVAAKSGCYGATSFNSTVNKPLMLSLALPRLLTPGDIVDIPVAVFALEENLGEVEVKLIADEKIALLDAPAKKIRFSQKGEQLVWFKIRINQQTGITTLRTEASSAQEKSSSTEEIEIRLPNPRITTFEEKIVQAGETVSFTHQLIDLKPQSTLEVSSIPPLHLEQRINYLLEYPHGCAEQIASKAFPQLSLPTLLQLQPEQLMQSERQIGATISQLANYQSPEGGFSYWIGQRNVSEWVSAYITHFLVSAKQKGYSVPTHLLQNAINYLQKRSNIWDETEPFAQQTQAYRLFVLALSAQPNIAAMNRLKECKLFRPATQWLLASTYVLIHQEEIAQRMIKELSAEIDSYRETGGTYGSTIRDYALILQSMIILDRQQDAYRMLEQISQAMSSTEWYNTQETAFSIHAAGLFVEKYLGRQEGINITIKTAEGEEQIKTNKTVWQYPLVIRQNKARATVSNKGKGALFVRQINSSIALEPVTHKMMSGLEMEIRYYNEKGDELNFKQLQQGQEVISEIKIKNSGHTGTYRELALSYLLPSGFEIINERHSPAQRYLDADHVDIRDDRFLVYFSLKQGESKIFKFRCNAAFKGEYMQPAIHCEAMYDNSIQAILPGGKVQIK